MFNLTVNVLHVLKAKIPKDDDALDSGPYTAPRDNIGLSSSKS